MTSSKKNNNRYLDEFIDPVLTAKNIDTYIIRRSIFDSLIHSSKLFSGSLLDIGAGGMPYREYLLENSSISQYSGLDIESASVYNKGTKPDYVWDGVDMPFDRNTFDCAFGTEVLEHCPDPTRILGEVHRVLKPGGVFFFTVPFLWNLHEVPHDEYRYTPFSMERHLKEAGFQDIQIKATGGWHASMAQMFGLWALRSPMRKWQRKLVKFPALIAIRYLIGKDKNNHVDFNTSPMITGLSGIAYKR